MAVLECLGLADLAMEPRDQLSGGQRQMVSLAQAIVHDPRVLLDEPTSALDLTHQVRLPGEFRALAAEGRIVVAVLHDRAMAARWADGITLLHRGALHSSGHSATVLMPGLLDPGL